MKKMDNTGSETVNIKNISVAGGGAMGSGIAHVFALNGFKVNVALRSTSSPEKVLASISKNMDRQIEKGFVTAENKKAALDRIFFYTSLEKATDDADMLIEALPENAALKKEFFSKADNVCPPHTIIASTTSAISITQLASVTKRTDKVIGMHFMNPVQVSNLVEVIRGFATSHTVTTSVMNLAKQIGKTPVEVNDYPGFIASRLLAVQLNEAIFALYEGVAGVQEIDTVMNLGMAYKMGPLQLADFIGLDIVLNVINVLNDGYGNPKFAPCPLLVNMFNAGHLGVKSGKGFYEYVPGTKEIKAVSVFINK